MQVSVFPLFRSSVQQALIEELFLGQEPASLSDLAARLSTTVSTVQREVDRLEQASIVTSRRVGRSRLVHANRDSPLYPHLLGLIEQWAGARPLLREALAGVEGIERAYIFGSWAAREQGQSAGRPHDVDVLVVGGPDPHQLDAACRRVERRLRLEVNPTIVTPDEWREPQSGFLKTVKRDDLVRLLP